MVIISTIAFGIITTIEFLGFRTMIFEAIESVQNIILVILLLSFFFGLISIRPFTDAFRIKRILFLNTKSDYHAFDHYLGKGKELYERSVYKLETELYEKLDAKSRKPKELPVDKILLTIVGGGIFVFFASLAMSWIFFPTDSEENSQIPFEAFILLCLELGAIGFFVFVAPWLEYKRRLENQLV